MSSETVIPNAMVDMSVTGAVTGARARCAAAGPVVALRRHPGGPAVAEDHFQFERVGFFVVDKDSYAGADRRGPIVFNRVCSLREAKATKAAKSGGGAQA